MLRFCIHHLLKLPQSIHSALGTAVGSRTGHIHWVHQDVCSRCKLKQSKQPGRFKTNTDRNYVFPAREMRTPIHQLQTDTHVPNNSTYS